jgi:DNA ligase D-like protein (predicted polymerase)
MARAKSVESRDGVELTNLDKPLYDGAGVTKRQLVDYLDAAHDRLLPVLADRPLSVIRARPGQQPFMQKNLPDSAPDWIERMPVWSESSKRTVNYPVCKDRRTLLWLANQRAVEFHPTLVDRTGRATHVIIDLDPPEGADFAAVVAVARLVKQALDDCGLHGVAKTSGAKGLHVFVPVETDSPEDHAAATRAIGKRTAELDPSIATIAYVKTEREGKVFVDSTRAGGATVAAVYSPRARPGVPVSYPLSWDELDAIRPGDVTVTSALDRLGDADPWAASMPAPQRLPDDLVAEGHSIPVARVAAMHEGKRRKRAAGG